MAILFGPIGWLVFPLEVGLGKYVFFSSVVFCLYLVAGKVVKPIYRVSIYFGIAILWLLLGIAVGIYGL